MSLLDIRPVGKEELLITWEDGHRSLYTFRDLRFYCPCAGCVDEMTGERTMTAEKISANIHALETAPVGRYALRFKWSDGHQTGIYSFELLRALCTCGVCKKQKAEKI